MPEETAVNAAPVVAGGGGAPASEPAPAQVSEPQGSTEPAAQSAEPAGSGQTQRTADNNIVASANTGDGIKFPVQLRFYISYILPFIVLAIFLYEYIARFLLK